MVIHLTFVAEVRSTSINGAFSYKGVSMRRQCNPKQHILCALNTQRIATVVGVSIELTLYTFGEGVQTDLVDRFIW